MNTSAKATTVNGAAISGDDLVRAFNELRAELVSTLYFMLGNHDDAQDAAQDAFMKCWRSRETLGDVRCLRSFIFRVGMNAAKDLQRSAWRRRAKPMTEATPAAEARDLTPPDALTDKETIERVRVALLELRSEEQAVFLLRQNGDLTFEEIAELRRTPVGTVKTQMRAALQKLRRVLQDK
ncbi:MAG TPA: RNA polymerase sigma factor [Gemmataceae bacterium]|nr:RNA polymerase sigma factor [Gemmataceae bacterium]